MHYFFLFLIQLNGNNISKIEYNKLLPEKIFNYCNSKILNQEQSNKQIVLSNIFHVDIFMKYINNNSEYLEKKLETKLNKINKFFLWEIIPEIITINNDLGFNEHDYTFIFKFNISNIIEGILNNIFPYELNKLLYDQKQLEKQLIIDFQDQLKNLIKIIGNIRSKYRIFQYLIKELNEKKEYFSFLPENELESTYELENNLLQTSAELMDLFGELDGLIIKSNFTLNNNHLDSLFFIYNMVHIHIKEKSQEYKNIENISLEAYKNFVKKEFNINKRIILKKPILPKNNNLFNKLPVDIRLSFNKYFEFKRENLEIVLSPGDLIKTFIDYFFRGKIHKVQNLIENNKWKSLKEQKKINIENITNKYDSLKIILKTLNTILNNEKLLSVIKIKKIIHNNIEYINTEEEIIGNILNKIIEEVIDIRE